MSDSQALDDFWAKKQKGKKTTKPVKKEEKTEEAVQQTVTKTQQEEEWIDQVKKPVALATTGRVLSMQEQQELDQQAGLIPSDESKKKSWKKLTPAQADEENVRVQRAFPKLPASSSAPVVKEDNPLASVQQKNSRSVNFVQKNIFATLNDNEESL
eukprot:TRINITY_DN15973_c0_g1::TRINITY_DN15973_c0_g1_i1::g.3746::m.3746 TRINITY_DN15973_c0_g1::TRINITY_DN15973_c0_g1_i1::g.3746  ORF type:complete len:156 (+),score=35.57,DUF2407_C/PF13373.1/0.44,V_ATPase_I/PF01496.14/3.1,SR-25/PF10500.4/4.3,SR-25/PF10500.4/49 TRINITY_DN15973_c0_g1_i1:123-590(+)